MTDNEMNSDAPTNEFENLYAAKESNQIIVRGDTLRIGVGNLHLNEEDNQGYAGLWLFVRDQPDLDEVKWVTIGDSFEIHGHHINVNNIDLDGRHVILDIRPPAN